MSQEENKPQKLKRVTPEQFRLLRAAARKRAMQLLFARELFGVIRNTITPEELDLFIDSLSDVEEDPISLSGNVLDNELAYITQLVNGVSEHLDEMDKLVREAASNWRLERIGLVERCIIRVAICEMMLIAKVTPGIAINEAVELSKKFGQAESPRFINGVLDKVRQFLEKNNTTEAVPATVQ